MKCLQVAFLMPVCADALVECVRVLLWSTALRPAKSLSDHIIELSETSFASGGGQQQISDLSFRGKDLDKPPLKPSRW
jgi:hypothetical protein